MCFHLVVHINHKNFENFPLIFSKFYPNVFPPMVFRKYCFMDTKHGKISHEVFGNFLFC